MKILYITTMYPVPAFPQQGIFCHEQVKALTKLGVDVTVAVPIPFYDRKIKQNKWSYEGININYIRFFKLPGALDFHKSGKALFSQLNRSFDLKTFDLYHADCPLPSGYAAMIAGKKYNKPYIVHGHGLDVFLDESYSGLKNCNEIADNCKKVYENADGIVGVSKKVIEKIQKRIDISEKSYVVYNGVDTDKFFPVERMESDTINISSIGNLIKIKGHDYTLKAIKNLVDKGYKNIHLTIAGRGPLEDELKQLAINLGIDDYVTFCGYVSYDEVSKIFQHSDIFVLPSWYEALGCVYLEAMACGVPVIGCKGNGIDEIIEDSETGYLVENKNLEQLTDSLIKLMDKQTRKKIGIAARTEIVEGYQWKNSAEKLINLYNDFM